MTSLLPTISHVEHRRGLAGVVDDDVVDVVVVDDVRDVLPTSTFRLNSLLLAWWRPPTAHPKSLAVRVPGTLEPAIILTLLSHRVLSELLLSTEGSFLAISVAVDEVIVLFGALLLGLV